MLAELLTLPERRDSIGPELIQFFQRELGDAWLEMCEKFMRSFSGTTFEVPGPAFLKSLSVDKGIVNELRKDDSIERRMTLMQSTGVNYGHLDRLWQAVEGKMLPPVSNAGKTKAQVLEEAAALVRRFPKLAADIYTMYRLSAKDRAATIGIVQSLRSTKPKETIVANKSKAARNPLPVSQAAAAVSVPKRLTAPQRRFIVALKGHAKAATPNQMSELIGSITPTKTIRALVAQGLVKQLKNGSVSLTPTGKKAA